VLRVPEAISRRLGRLGCGEGAWGRARVGCVARRRDPSTILVPWDGGGETGRVQGSGSRWTAVCAGEGKTKAGGMMELADRGRLFWFVPGVLGRMKDCCSSRRQWEGEQPRHERDCGVDRQFLSLSSLLEAAAEKGDGDFLHMEDRGRREQGRRPGNRGKIKTW
jgi:hypothetical protein